MPSLDEWIVRTVCSDIRRWLDAGVTPPRVAFIAPTWGSVLTDTIRDALRRWDIPGDSIAQEIDGTADWLGPQAGSLVTLRDLGVENWLDNFGAGYAPLMQLRHLPVQAIKIPVGFIQDALKDARARAIVESIVSLAHTLDLRVIAEAVDSSEQVALLRELGCDAAQGYYFKSPQSPDAVARLLKEESSLYSLSQATGSTRSLNGASSFLSVDAASREVTRNGVLLTPPLSRKDFDVLYLLYENRGSACSKDAIAQRGWPERSLGDVADQDIQSCIHRIRVAIEPDPANPKHLLTIRQFGYRLVL
jgi:EAL domain-containing protein (putative c-di-GMP-specific phosphodiesterase class I)